MTSTISPFAGYEGRHAIKASPETVAQVVDGAMDLWEMPDEAETRRIPVVVGGRVVAVALAPHDLYRPLAIDADIRLVSSSTVYVRRRTWAERWDDALIAAVVTLLWLALLLTTDRPRRPWMWGESRAAYEARTTCSPKAMAKRATDVDAGDDEFDEVDTTEAEVDAMVAEGEPVAVLPLVPRLIADELELEMQIRPPVLETFTDTWARMTPELEAVVKAELDAKRSAVIAA